MSAPPPSPAVTEIAAPVLLGVIGDWTLYGTLVVQLYSYSYNFPEDRKTFKLLVYAISSLETLRTTLSGVDMYYKFASGFGSMDRLSDPYMFVFQVSIIGAVISMAVQYFFAYRVWMLSNKTSFWLCTIICTCSTVNATAELTWGVYAHVLKRFRNGWQLKVFSLTWLIGNTVTNTMITTAMLYHLTRQLSYEGGSIFGHSLTKIMGLTIESNVLTFTSGIIALLMIAIFPDKMWYTFP
ncbi:hypothetical protein F5148DRAFT_521710 [Russula earlei]|uniref:Uncharacterized protein n=1 Tax=Russula earlei TaxID=71964 RepID=A0ACC0TWS7_9AGAM|nr:hypothetical protein F5148DRAFT_521710 [Russula earlei]